MTALAEILARDQAAELARLRAQLPKPPPAIFLPPPFENAAGTPPHSLVAWPRPARRKDRQ